MLLKEYSLINAWGQTENNKKYKAIIYKIK